MARKQKKNHKAKMGIESPGKCIYRYRVSGEEHWRCGNPLTIAKNQDGMLRPSKYKTGKWCDDKDVFPDRCPLLS